MILDNEVLFWDKEVTPGPASVFIDLGSKRPGPGEPVTCFISGTNTSEPLTLFVNDSPDGVGNVGTVMTVDGIDFTTDPVVEFSIPSTTERWIRVQFEVEPTTGTFSAGVVMKGNQTNR